MFWAINAILVVILTSIIVYLTKKKNGVIFIDIGDFYIWYNF